MARKKKETVEADVQGNIIKWAKARFIKVIRLALQPGVETGWPDTEFLLPGGRPAFIECKRPGETPTKKQLHMMQEMEKDGYDVAWFDNSEDAIAWLADRLEKARDRLRQ